MLVSRPLTIPKILGGEAWGRKKVRMAVKWDKSENTVIRCRFGQDVYIGNTSFLDYSLNKIMAHCATRLSRHV
jgi:hypothetical protein